MSFESQKNFSRKSKMLLTSVHIERNSLEKLDKLEQMSEEDNRSRIIRRAIREYLERNYKEK